MSLRIIIRLSPGLPLLLLAPLLALQFGLTMESTTTLLLSLVLGTPGLSLIGAVWGGAHGRAARAGRGASDPSRRCFSSASISGSSSPRLIPSRASP